MKYLYYCNSLYQIITVLELHLQRKECSFENIDNYQADLIVLDAFSGADDIVKIIESNNIFNQIWLIDKKIVKKKVGHIKTFIDLIFPRIFLNDIGLSNVDCNYDYLTVSKYSKLLSSVWQINRKAKLQLFDEGLATYSLAVSLQSHSYIYSHFYKAFNYGRDFYDFEKVYVNNLKLVIVNDDRFIEIAKNEHIINRIKEIFSLTKTSINLNKKIYWFDQIFYLEKSNIVSEKSLNVLNNYKDDVLFFPHPRTPRILDNYETAREKTLWEINVLNHRSISNKCLITNSSTACLSPKLLFDMEPYIIMTFLLGEDENSKYYELMVRFIETYRNKSKIMLPKNIDELKNCLTKVKSQK